MGAIIGITGAIGSGKSTLSELLATFEPSHAVYESREVITELAEDFNRALSGELAFETTNDNIELINQALIWFVESISEKLHQEVTWNQLAITKHQLAQSPELFQKILTYLETAKAQPRILDTRITQENKEQYRPLLQWLGSYLVARVSRSIWYDEIFRRIDIHDNDKSLIVINGLRYPADAMVVRAHGGIIIEIDRPQQPTDTTDPTESSRDQIKSDITVHNNGTPEELSKLAEQFWDDFMSGKTTQEYTAANTTSS